MYLIRLWRKSPENSKTLACTNIHCAGVRIFARFDASGPYLRSEVVQSLKNILTNRYGKPVRQPRSTGSASDSNLGESDIAEAASTAAVEAVEPSGSTIDTMQTVPMDIVEDSY